MKKCILLLVGLFLLAGMVAAPNAVAEKKDAPLKVVTTIFPPYDFVRRIAGDAVELTMLLQPGTESHSFEPSPRDIIKIQECDVFIYVGGETDAWVDRILESMDTGGMTILPLTGMVSTVAEEIIEGMEHDPGHDHGEFDPDAVYDRALSDWAGAWKSLEGPVRAGELDAYLQALADGEDFSVDEARERKAANWDADFETIRIDGDTVSIDEKPGSVYAYEGYFVLETDHGASVWYGYAAQDERDDMPAYMMFNDHGYGAPEEHESGQDAHDGDGVAHTHLRYGSDSFDALLHIEHWSPFFVEDTAATDEILETLIGHGVGNENDEMDEHVWTSLRNAEIIVKTLAQVLSELDEDCAAIFRENAAAYAAELRALDLEYEAMIAGAARNTIVFADRFPFRYMADDYGLDYYAAFPGCATETEASASTIAFLVDRVADDEYPAVFTIEFSNGKIARTICESTGAKQLEMHSCHNVSKKDFEAGVTYLDLMRENLSQLKEALN